MGMLPTVGIVGLAVFVAGVLAHENRSYGRRVTALLGARAQLGPKEFGETYFSSSGRRAAIAGAVRGILSDHVNGPIAGLLPDDRFDQLLNEYDSMVALELLIDVEEKFDVRIPDEMVSSIGTTEDLVDYLEQASDWEPAPAPHGRAG